MNRLITRELKKLNDAVAELLEPTEPWVPPPRRPKIFQFGKGIRWPFTGDNRMPVYGRVDILSASPTITDPHVADRILITTGYQPRRVMRAVIQIRAATQWCKDRAEGRRRASQEVVRQQDKWAKQLRAELILSDIAGDD